MFIFENGKLMFLFDKSFFDFSAYVNLRPDDPTGYFYKGQAAYFMGNRQEGCAALQKGAQLGSKDAEQKLAQLCR